MFPLIAVAVSLVNSLSFLVLTFTLIKCCILTVLLESHFSISFCLISLHFSEAWEQRIFLTLPQPQVTVVVWLSLAHELEMALKKSN